MSYFLVLRELITSSTFHSLWVFDSLVSMKIAGPGLRIWPENGLLWAKCSFHRWNTGVSAVFFICWGISSSYTLLAIFQIISHSPAFFTLSNLLSYSLAKCCIHIDHITNLITWMWLAMLIGPVNLLLLCSCQLILQKYWYCFLICYYFIYAQQLSFLTSFLIGLRLFNTCARMKLIVGKE